MKKLLLLIVIFLSLILGGVILLLNSISTTITDDDLPQAVYQNTDDFDMALTQALIDVFNPFNDVSPYSFTEIYINVLIYQAIIEHINASYDPLSDCETDACNFIYKEGYGGINYLFATITDNDQLKITLSIKHDRLIEYNTAMFIYFDVDINVMQNRLLLTFDRLHVGPHQIPNSVIHLAIEQLDHAQVEAMFETGTLDLKALTYEVYLTELLP